MIVEPEERNQSTSDSQLAEMHLEQRINGDRSGTQ